VDLLHVVEVVQRVEQLEQLLRVAPATSTVFFAIIASSASSNAMPACAQSVLHGVERRELRRDDVDVVLAAHVLGAGLERGQQRGVLVVAVAST
jgi:hypothetical protein